jgi:iron complex outermembrane recepter protein
MIRNLWSLLLLVAGAFFVPFIQPVQAQESPSHPPAAPINLVPNAPPNRQPATTVQEWQAQIIAAALRVTNIKLEPDAKGLTIILETADGKPLQVDATRFKREGNRLIADIPNAVLALPNLPAFSADNPTADITNVQVTQVDAGMIRISVTGNNAPPKSEVTLKTAGLAYALNPDKGEADEEVVVTGAGRRDYRVPNASTALGTNTPILDTPFSVQVVPQSIIRDQQALDLKDALNNVSGVTFTGTAGGRQSNFNIRGFGDSFGTSVPVLRDGYRLYGSFQAIPELANLERVETLKGPASILFGQIDPGGVINLVSKSPLSAPFYEGELQVGSRELVRPRVDLSGPLTQSGNLLYRFNALYRHERSFRDFDTADHRISLAPTLAWKINNRTDLNLSLEYVRNSGPADFGLTRFGDGVAPVPLSRVVNNPDDTITTNYLSLGYSFEHRFNTNWKLRNGFRYIRYTYDYSTVALPFSVQDDTVIRFYADQDGQDSSYSLYSSLIGTFNTGSIKHNLSFGVDLNRSEDRIFTLFAPTPIPLNIFDPNYTLFPKPDRSTIPLFADARNTSSRLGIYLQDQIYLRSNLIFVAGFRYDTVTRNTRNVQTPFVAGGETERTDSALTPRFGLLYRPIPELALFANYSQSFKPNTVATVSGTPLEPERGSGFEIGAKTEVLNGKLFATLTYFDIKKQNVATSDPAFPLFSIAVGEQRSRGFEFDLVGEPRPGWKIIASYAYINAKVTSDTDSTLIGNQLFGAPTHAASLWTTYEIQTGTLKGLGFGTGFNYGSERFGNLANDLRIGDYFIVNAAIFYRRDPYRFAINIKNITSAGYIRAATGNEGGNEPGEPLTVIGSFSVSF